MRMGLLPLEFTECLQDSPYFRDSLHSHEKELERTSNNIKTSLWILWILNDVFDSEQSIMKPADPVTEELLRNASSKLDQIRPKLQEIRVSTFWMSGKSMDPRRRPTQPASLVSFKPITAPKAQKVITNI